MVKIVIDEGHVRWLEDEIGVKYRFWELKQ